MRAVRREPDFDEVPQRRSRRAAALDVAPRPMMDRRGGKRGRHGPDPIAMNWDWLPHIAWRSPMFVGSASFLALAVVAGLLAGGHVGFGGDGGQAFATADSAWFPIEDIRATGQYHARKRDLFDAIGAKPGDDMLDIDPEIVRARIESLDWIDHADVARLWPATLQVQVFEKEPYALWQTKGVTWLIDHAGSTITKDDIAEFAGLPLVVGPGAPEHAVELVEILNRFPDIQRKLKASVRVGDRRWDLHLKNGMQVRLPEDGVEDALHRLAALEQEQKIFERDIESVDLRLPDRLVVKPRGGAAESVAKGEST